MKRILAFLLLLCFVAPVVGQEIEPEVELQVDCPQFENAILWLQCGSSNDRDNLNLMPTLREFGWRGVDKIMIRPYVDWFESKFGKKLAIIVHLPDGREITSRQTNMPINGRQTALRKGFYSVTDHFVETFKKYVDAGHKVIIYRGLPSRTVELRDHWESGEFDVFWRKADLAFECADQIGAGKCLDAFGSTGREAYDVAFYTRMARQSNRYLEPTLEIDAANDVYWNENAILLWATYSKRHTPWQHASAAGRFPHWRSVGDGAGYECENWYGGQVICLFAGSDIPNTEKATQRCIQMRDWKSIPAFVPATWLKIVEAYPVMAEVDGE